ncbi:LPS export ABC transporter periplasmic protein LptC [Muriicola soli]|uniref:LPS export ABC transporter periplasmic protein LptC n=1 Tax=Muriicola soli TaxID=2507538 RepID=A0A411EDE2_9FLAO|nr:LPS export ABC transporter periplasmic protein LptC [Muriicola soli]QBA65655.1 LPS export ABC transporter periplasmic protein LptC [Muriicola soli]
MIPKGKQIIYPIAIVCTVAIFFFGCQDNYKRVGDEKQIEIYPQGIAQNFELTYTETTEELESEDKGSSRVIAILKSPVSEDFDNMLFKYRTFPEGLEVEYYDQDNKKSTISADYGIIYSQTSIIDLRGQVVIETHDGKKLETSQLYWDRKAEWIFTQEKFTFTNPQDGTVMDGEGMDFDRDFSFFKANKTYGLMTINEEES